MLITIHLNLIQDKVSSHRRVKGLTNIQENKFKLNKIIKGSHLRALKCIINEHYINMLPPILLVEM